MRASCLAVLLLPLSILGCTKPEASDCSLWSGEACAGFDTVALSPERLALSRITGLDVDSRGQIYVGDGLTQHVVVLGPDGAVVRTLGRAGEGPGEFRLIVGLSVLPGDSVAVYDLQLRRLTVFAPHSGDVARTLRIHSLAGGIPMQVAPRYGGGYFATYERPFGPEQEPDSGRVVVVRLLDGRGNLRQDSLLTMPASASLVVRAKDFVMAGDHPLGRTTLLRFGRSRVFAAASTEPVVHMWTAEGRWLGTTRLPWTAVPLGRKTIEDSAAGLPALLRPAFLASVPSTWPPIRALAPESEGGLWVGLNTQPDTARTWVVLDSAGRPVSSYRLPWSVTVHQVRGDLVYAETRDSDDVPRVVVLRLVRRGGHGPVEGPSPWSLPRTR